MDIRGDAFVSAGCSDGEKVAGALLVEAMPTQYPRRGGNFIDTASLYTNDYPGRPPADHPRKPKGNRQSTGGFAAPAGRGALMN